MIKAGIVVALLAGSTAADARELVIGLGGTDFSSQSGRNGIVLDAELHGAPFGSLGRIAFSPAVAGSVDSHGDLWIGAGISAVAPLGRGGWFLEGSVMPGVYMENDDGNDLGSAFEIRSLIGVGYGLSGGAMLSFAVEHKSNADTGNTNPGANAFTVRLRRAF